MKGKDLEEKRKIYNRKFVPQIRLNPGIIIVSTGVSLSETLES
jgi:hypothetical protein